MMFHGDTFDFGEDYTRLKNNTQRVFALLLDGAWHSAINLREVGGERWSARVRQLREPQMGSLVVEAERLDGGVWRYRLDLDSLTVDKSRAIAEWTVDASHKKEMRKTSKKNSRLAGDVMATLERGQKRLDGGGNKFICIPVAEARALWVQAKEFSNG